MRHLEDIEQSIFFTRLTWEHKAIAQIAFHIPNGGKRDIREAGRLKAQGVRAGVPDIFIPLAAGSYHGLFIEMKRCIEPKKPKPTISKEQKNMLELLSNQGYKCVVAYGADEAIAYLNEYLMQQAS